MRGRRIRIHLDHGHTVETGIGVSSSAVAGGGLRGVGYGNAHRPCGDICAGIVARTGVGDVNLHLRYCVAQRDVKPRLVLR